MSGLAQHAMATASPGKACLHCIRLDLACAKNGRLIVERARLLESLDSVHAGCLCGIAELHHGVQSLWNGI